MIGAAADMNNDCEELVGVVHVRAVLRSVAQLQLKGEHHPVHQLAHPGRQHRKHVFRIAVITRHAAILYHDQHDSQIGLKAGQSGEAPWIDSSDYVS